MRTFSANQQAIWKARGGQTARLRVKVKDVGGTYRDLTTYAGSILPGLNLVTSGDWGDDVDGNGQTGTFTFKRNVDSISLAPLMTASPLNTGLSPTGSYAPLLDLHRKVQVDACLLPDDVDPQSSDWMPVFEGYIDQVHMASDSESISIDCSDNSAAIRDCFIQFERVYGYALTDGVHAASPPRGVFIWEPAVVYDNNDWVIPSEANQNGFAYQNESGISDTSSASEPLWPLTPGATVADGVSSGLDWTNAGTTLVTRTTAVETIIQQLLDDNLGVGVVTLNVPSSPGFVMRMFQQQRQGLLEAISAFILLFGWDLRYRYDDGSASWKFTLQAVNRSPGSPAWTFTDPAAGGSSGESIFKWNALDLDIQGIRNDFACMYSDPTDRDLAGNPKRKRATDSDSTSIGNYGDRFMEIAEGNISPIDTPASAANMLAAIKADLANPKADAEVEGPFFPWVEVQDYYQWDPDGLLHDTAFSAAVVKYRHKVEVTKARTTITVRGKPCSGYGRWHAIAGYVPPAIDLHREQSVGFDSTVIQSSLAIGGQQFQVNPASVGQGNQKDAPPPEWEFHVDVTSGFTPSASTLKQDGPSRTFSVHDQIPGSTRYLKVVPKKRNASRIVRGLPSQAVSFVVSQAKAGHLSADPDLTRLPLNGSFETNLDPNGPPDHWTETAGTWATDISLITSSSTAVTGDSYLSFANTATSKQLNSDLFIVEPYNLYSVSAWVQGNFLGDNNDVQIKWYDQNRAAITGSEVTAGPLGVPGGSWRHKRAAGFAPSNARFGQVQIFQDVAGTAHGFLVDAIEVNRLKLTGLLVWGNSTPSAAAVTHYMTPGGGAGATDANERKLRAIVGEYTLAGLSVRARVGSTNVTYVVTLRRNGNNSTLTATLAAAGTSADDSTHAEITSKQLGVLLSDELSMQVVSTIGAGPVAATDLFVTVGIYQ